ncbi:MAG TPA: ABC transporter permease [Candidatus Didemnitutus sp.]|jgi:predicted permease
MPIFRALFRRSDTEKDLRREMEYHLEREAEQNVRHGMSPAEARLAAERAFGGVAQVQEEVRDAWGVRFLDHLRQDLAYGWRGLRHRPGFALVVIFTLALGIGANTAIFSVVQGVLLRPLAYAAPDRLVLVNQAAPVAGQPSIGFSVPDFQDFRARNRAFSSMAEYHSMWFILLGRAEPERVQTGVVSDNFFDLLGVKPLLGRTFLPGEDRPGAAPVLVLSYEYWQHSFGGDAGVVGRVFEMNNKPHTVVGVLPPLPAFPNADQIFMPASACPFRGAPAVIGNRQGRLISNVFARLRDGVSPQQAIEDARRVGLDLCGEFPADYPKADGYVVETTALATAFTGPVRRPLLVLLATAGFVLLIACANVANLSLARLVRRERELAVRAALGAGRARLLRQLLTENLLLALLGGLAGLALAAIGLHVLIDYAARFLPRADEIAINGPVLAFTGVLSIATGLLFGSRPPLPTADGLVTTLKDGTRTTGRSGRLRTVLVISQVAISVPLLAGAGLAIRSLIKLQQVDPGMQPARVLAANLNLNWTRYDNFEKRYGFWSRTLAEAAKLPGVTSVAMSGTEPLNGLAFSSAPFAIENKPVAAGAPAPRGNVLFATEDYFTTIGQPLLRGRFFRATDSHDTKLPVAIINQSLASHYWPGEDVVGRRVTFDNGANWITIVGVVADTREQIDAPPVEEVYIPLQLSSGLISGTVLVRTNAAPAALVRELREAIRRADAQQPVTSIETIDQVRRNALAPRRLIATLLGLFAAVALVITAAGIGGVLAFSVSQRTQEIGIRMALGASRADVRQLVLREGLVPVLGGLVLGTVLALVLTKLMTTVLYDVPPTDPVTFVVVALALLVVATVACLVPARRASSIDPMTALRIG